MDNTIVAENVYKSYGHIEALHGLSLTVKTGEIFGMLGANGAGKTTLIKALVGILRLDSGTVNVLGLNPIKQAHELRRQIGYMPQSPALYDDLTARDNVRFFARAHVPDNLEQKIDEIMEFIDLVDRQNDQVYGFSGGMKQRLSLACALVHEPRLLLLDEPSTGVDPKLRETLWQRFRELTNKGTTILLSTHQMDEAFHCDRVAVMRNGVVLDCDTPHGLMSLGKTTITIWRGGEAKTEVVDNYREQLPQMLGVDSSIDKIEVREDTLEDVILSMIAEKEG
jgi:ABC-2 type transport system ATP-binding protein